MNKVNSNWIIQEGGITDEVVEFASNLAKLLVQGGHKHEGKKVVPLTTSQIRKFFGELKRIEADFDKKKHEIPLLKAKLAYAVGRNKKQHETNQIVEFYDAIKDVIPEIKQDQKRFKRFVQIVEAIVAFHKFHGGKD